VLSKQKDKKDKKIFYYVAAKSWMGTIFKLTSTKEI